MISTHPPTCHIIVLSMSYKCSKIPLSSWYCASAHTHSHRAFIRIYLPISFITLVFNRRSTEKDSHTKMCVNCVKCWTFNSIAQKNYLRALRYGIGGSVCVSVFDRCWFCQLMQRNRSGEQLCRRQAKVSFFSSHPKQKRRRKNAFSSQRRSSRQRIVFGYIRNETLHSIDVICVALADRRAHRWFVVRTIEPLVSQCVPSYSAIAKSHFLRQNSDGKSKSDNVHWSTLSTDIRFMLFSSSSFTFQERREKRNETEKIFLSTKTQLEKNVEWK